MNYDQKLTKIYKEFAEFLEKSDKKMKDDMKSSNKTGGLLAVP